MNISEYNEIVEPNDQTEARQEHLSKLRALIGNAYPNKYERSRITGAEDTISNVLSYAPVTELVKQLKENTTEGEKPDQELKGTLNEKLKAFGSVRVSGRLAVPPRVMGKAAFVHLSDGKARLQIYVRKQDAVAINNDTGKASEEEGKAWEVFGLLDHGDFVGVEGYLFLTNTGELSVHVEQLQFLSKALLPMPDKIHGISDPELQRRFRYADLIADSLKIDHAENELTTREVFERRAKLISGMRRYLDEHDYIEVETPMLTPKATGAAARAFETHHNALDIPLYARIAPELYLKRLVVGGFEKVYELNRNFRNEGLSQKHNPEFTMLEFYCAYMDVNGMMDFAEAMIQEAVKKANNDSLIVRYGENVIDFSKFEKLTIKKAIAKYWLEEFRQLGDDYFEIEWLDSPEQVLRLREFLGIMRIAESEYISGIKLQNLTDTGARQAIDEKLKEARVNERGGIWYTAKKTGFLNIESSAGKALADIFEYVVESKLIQPTFIIDYPKSISPLSKASPENPQIAERFELFINGMECANGFSELNDPQEQYERFVDQMKERESGDHEAMVMDEDYIRALAYGMPPAAGIGIGIDRLVMLLTNRHSIRDVILFPHMRPERKDEEKGKRGEDETGAAA
jgi:lysyl-tRNA synthetase class 2